MSEADLVSRLEKLERDDRRLKRGGLAALALLAVLLTIYAAQPVPEKITAHEFDMTDSSGRVRAQITIGPVVAQGPTKEHVRAGGKEIPVAFEPVIDLYDAQGRTGTEIAPRDITLYGSRVGSTTDISPQSVTFGSKNEVNTIIEPGYIMTFDHDGAFTVQGASVLLTHGRTDVGIAAEEEPEIRLADPQGFEMDVGSTATVTATTGQTQHTSADSIVMYGNDKDHRVIWQAP